MYARPHPLAPSPKREGVLKPSPFRGRVGWGLILLCSFLSSLSPLKAQYYNGSYLNFGRSRVQYYTDKFVWSYNRYQKFDVYFYTGGKNLAEYTARYTQKRLPEIERLFDVDLEERIQFVVYNRQSHFLQSNAGLNTESAEQNAADVSNMEGQKKIFLYFDGNHQHLEQQITEGIARTLFNNFMFGQAMRERLKFIPVSALPNWYTEGLFAYTAQPWSTDADNKMMAEMRNPAFFKLNRLTPTQAKLAGHSIWNYLAQTYGQNIIAKILYMTKMGRSANNGFLYVLGLNIPALRAQWINFYDKQYPPAQDSLRSAPMGNAVARLRADREYYNFTPAPNSNKIAYVVNRKGRYKIMVTTPGQGKPIKIYKGGDQAEQAIDASYPLLAWNPANNGLSFFIERKGEIWLFDYDSETKTITKKPIYHFDKITAMQYMPDGQNILLSAVRNGITDLYTLNLPSNTYKALTNDKPDDLTPLLFNNAVVFSSNRGSDSINPKIEQHLVLPTTDLFRLPLQGQPKLLQRITNTPNVNETQPIVYDTSRIAFLSNQSGIPNRYSALFDSVVAFIDTTVHYRFTSAIANLSNYRYPILAQSSNAKQTTLLFALDKTNTALYFDTPTEGNAPNEPVYTHYAKFGPDTAWKKFKNPISIGKGERIKVFGDTTQNPQKIDINNYEFETEKDKPKDKQPVLQPLPFIADTTAALPDSFRLTKQRIYLTSFYPDAFSAKFDRNFIAQGYQPFNAASGYTNPPISGLFKITLRDVMEDYRITGAFRLSTTLVGNEYLLRFENLKHRLDRELILHRMGIQNGFDNTTRVLVHQAIYGIRYPFKQTLWAKASLLGRVDRTVYTGARPENLSKPNDFAYWAAINTEGIFDNTLRNGINILYGTRVKVWAQFYYRFDKRKTNTAIIGIDYRHYQRIHRNFIAAFRVAASTSFGAGKLMYYMGGVDGALIPRFDNDASIDNSQTYLFQALANGVRGFNQNIRNGNTFMLASVELRLPVFKYLLNVNVRSEVVNNFQLVAFADAGSAYVGLNPYADINTFTTRTIQQGPLNITVKTQREPFIAGLGWGVRTKILGYFIRADLARGLENGNLNKTRFYLSFGTDF